jgi:hypothetical protein
MPPKNYSNITVRMDVREELDRLREELKVNDFSDLLVTLVRIYREYTSSTSKVDELLTSISSKVREELDKFKMELKVEDLSRMVAELLTSVTSKSPQTGVSSDFTKKVEDLINAYTSKIDDIARKYAELVEKVDELKELVQSTIKTSEKSGKSDSEGKHKKDLCEILTDEGVIYESEIAGRIKNRDSYFRKIEEVCGGGVFEAKGQRVAVSKEFMEEFMKKLESLDTNDESKLKKVLGKEGYKLLKTLWEGGVVYYDSVNKKWVLTKPKSVSEEELEDIDYV